MSLTTWLFLYIAGLVELAVRYRLAFKGGAVLLIVLPVVAIALLRPQRGGSATSTYGARVLGTLLTLVCATWFARRLNLEFWDTQRLDLAALSAGIGIGSLLGIVDETPSDTSAHSDPSHNTWHNTWQIANWLIVGVGWMFAALWSPVAPWLALAPAASLGLWPRSAMAAPIDSATSSRAVSAAWLLFWIGMALPKSWWDSSTWGALGTMLWAFAVACTYLPGLRRLRPPQPLLWIAFIPLLYVWVPIWIWAPLLGLASGWALQQSARPWHRAAPYALLFGLLLSYALHSNLQWFGWLVWFA